MKKLFLVAWALLLSSHVSSQETVLSPHEERVISYHSDITINKDATVDVVETIKVYANGNDIQRGIYRNYPTEYKDKDGYYVSVGFEVVEVLKNGEEEPFHIEGASNGDIVYIGDADVYLDPGEYTYTIRYRTDRQIGFFDEYDELYYNVNGTGWIFPMAQISATVHLPDGAEITQYDGYTGYEGETGKDFEAVVGNGEISFTTTRVFDAYENLTIAVAWPKGIVARPPNPWKETYLMIDQWKEEITSFFLILLFLYWFNAWRKVGIDPPKGTIVPLFDPPKGFSPADCHFVHHQSYSKKALAADIVDMGVKGLLSIKYKKGKFSLHKTTGAGQAEISSAQKKLLDSLLGGRGEIELDQKNHSTIGSAVSAHEQNIRKELDGVHFKLNRQYIFVGLLISALGMLALVPWGKEDAGFLIFWLCFVSLPVIALSSGFFSALMNLLSRGYGWGPVIGFFIFAVPALLTYFIVMINVMEDASPLLFVLLFIVINALFIYLIKAPTVQGRKVMDQLEGLRLFLKKAEEHRFNQLQTRETALEFFEKLLPFAIALGVENEWGEHFESFFKSDSGQGDYRPAWYFNSSMSHFSSNAFSHSIGSSLSSSISSSSTAPGSSSGSGGGGSSGGGGGGGGGGGW